MSFPTGSITGLLRQAHAGDAPARERLLAAVYPDLHDVARAYLFHENAMRTLDSRALVHESYLRLFGKAAIPWKNRKHFFVVVARSMRRIICDYARQAKADKRGGGEMPYALSGVAWIGQSGAALGSDRAALLLSLNHVLEELEAGDPHMAKLIRCRFFFEMTIPETAKAMGMSTRSVSRELRIAKAMLFERLAGSATHGQRRGDTTTTAGAA